MDRLQSATPRPRNSIMGQASEVRHPWLIVLVPFLLLTIPLCFLGYGADGDIFLELDAAALTWEQGMPTMSRHPGYWLHEAYLYAFDSVGGPLLINVSTLVASVVILWRIWRLTDGCDLAWRLPLLACLALNPWFLIASSSGIDYNIALLFLILSIEAMLRLRTGAAGLAGGTAILIRLGSAPPLGTAMAFLALGDLSWPNLKRLALSGSIITVLVVGGYSISYVVAGYSFQFLTPHIGTDELWTTALWLGRAVYKPLLLLGFPASVIVVALLVLHRHRWSSLLKERGPDRQLILASLGVIAGTLIMYVRYPLEISYLLPALAMFVVVCARAMSGHPPLIAWILAACVIGHNVVAVQIAAPDRAELASSARFAPRIESGVLLRDLEKRLRVMQCERAPTSLSVVEGTVRATRKCPIDTN